MEQRNIKRKWNVLMVKHDEYNFIYLSKRCKTKIEQWNGTEFCDEKVECV